MNHVARRARLAFVVAALFVSLGAAASDALGVHPGGSGAVTYPTKEGIRVDRLSEPPYDLPFSGATDLTWTPDGRFIAFALAVGEDAGIYVADAAGCGAEQVTFDSRDRAPAFDGISMYFTRGSSTYTLDYDSDAESSPVTGTPEETSFGTDVSVSVIEGRWAHVEPPNTWHPGEYVLLLTDVFLRTEPVEVFRSTDPVRATEWSPDGSLLAFEATAEDGSTQIFGADVVGDPIDVTQLVDSPTNSFMPAFSPDGETLAWFGGTTRQNGIVSVRDLGTGADTVVTQEARFALDWQPVVPGGLDVPAPVATTTSVTLNAPSEGPGEHTVTITVDPAPPSGTAELALNGAAVDTIELDDAGTGYGVIDLPEGSHEVSATFTGTCPYNPSEGELLVEVQEASPTATPSPTTTPTPPPTSEPPFDDLDGSPFVDEIAWLAETGITSGCGPERFCPDGLVSRGQIASFVSRAFSLPAAHLDWFGDDDGRTHEADINRLAEAGITGGCGTRRFCPYRAVARGEMASFLARALELPPATQDWFDDDDGRMHEANINRLAEAGITGGCGTRRYCPSQLLTREQMAAILYRALAPAD